MGWWAEQTNRCQDDAATNLFNDDAMLECYRTLCVCVCVCLTQIKQKLSGNLFDRLHESFGVVGESAQEQPIEA